MLTQAMNLGRIVDDVVTDADRIDPQACIHLYLDVLDWGFLAED